MKQIFQNTDNQPALRPVPWYSLLRCWLRGGFRPVVAPRGGYAAFAQEWSVPVEHKRIAQQQQKPVVTWLGHASILLQVAGLNILIDPALAARAGPQGRFGARRGVPAPLAASDLPSIDIVLITHNHYDHLCSATLDALLRAGQKPYFFIPMGLKQWFDNRAIAKVRELAWWEQVDLATTGLKLHGSLRLHFTPAQHWSRRTLWDTNTSLWGGYALEWGAPLPPATDATPWRFFFPGDTGYSTDFKSIRQRIGTMDFVALPIGAYLPRTFMRPIHVNPADAVQILLDLGAPQAMAVHWGTFMLTQEAFDQPPKDLIEALREHKLAPETVWLMRHGETRSIPVSRQGSGVTLS